MLYSSKFCTQTCRPNTLHTFLDRRFIKLLKKSKNYSNYLSYAIIFKNSSFECIKKYKQLILAKDVYLIYVLVLTDLENNMKKI